MRAQGVWDNFCEPAVSCGTHQASVEAQGNNPQEIHRLLATAASIVEMLRTASFPAQNNSIWNGILEITAQERTRLTIRS